MKLTIKKETMSLAYGSYTGKVTTIQCFDDNKRILIKLLLDDGILFVKVYQVEDFASYPWSDIFRALDTDDTDDLLDKTVEFQIVNSVSKSTGTEFSNIKKVRLVSDKHNKLKK